jgi:hypothetical protein
LYIGKGCRYRYLASAKKHGGIAGIIEHFKREKDALKREIELIAEFSPPLNKTKGGEGKSKQPYRNPDLIIKREQDKDAREAYRKADESPSYLNILAAACYARIELNSRGIKETWPAEVSGLEPVDQKVDSAIRRLHDWRLFPPPASLRSTICLA